MGSRQALAFHAKGMVERERNANLRPKIISKRNVTQNLRFGQNLWDDLNCKGHEIFPLQCQKNLKIRICVSLNSFPVLLNLRVWNYPLYNKKKGDSALILLLPWRRRQYVPLKLDTHTYSYLRGIRTSILRVLKTTELMIIFAIKRTKVAGGCTRSCN